MKTEEIDRILAELEEAFPEGEIVHEDAGRESDCPYFLFRNWFLEFLIPAGKMGKSDLQALFNLKLNLGSREREIHKKADAMGLISYHFDTPLSEEIRKLGIKVMALKHPQYKTAMILTADSAKSLKATIHAIMDQNVSIMEKALQLLQNLETRYSL
jgi:hypothetical protein